MSMNVFAVTGLLRISLPAFYAAVPDAESVIDATSTFICLDAFFFFFFLFLYLPPVLTTVDASLQAPGSPLPPTFQATRSPTLQASLITITARVFRTR
ncbi:hypothetical protein TNCT_240021 [Trichonephila clavata]|uniref:Uncharacterized protein n=1 Tax=Trichonephila clavata TaxID=2740835 RepID=A0A8X6FHG0_TRICU|nr:hypothetical protein TNCT_240021 [Trichonephila clavata]